MRKAQLMVVTQKWVVFFSALGACRIVCLCVPMCVCAGLSQDVVGDAYIWTCELVHVCTTWPCTRRAISFHAILFLI